MKIIPYTLLATTLFAGSALAAQQGAPAFSIDDDNAYPKGYFNADGAIGRLSGDFSSDAGISGSGHATVGGVELSGGAYFADSSVGVHQLGASIGILGGSTNKSDIGGADLENTYIAVPLIVEYNYNFKLAEKTFFYIGPRAGISILSERLDITAPGTELKSSDADLSFVIGAGLGFRHFFTESFGLEIGYDYRRLSSTEYDHDFNGTRVKTKLEDIDLHIVKFGLAFRF